jgi:hypothetical protein
VPLPLVEKIPPVLPHKWNAAIFRHTLYPPPESFQLPFCAGDGLQAE